MTADPTAAWVAEGDEIPISDPTLAELTVTPAKVAGLTIVSRELADDSDPAAAYVVGAGLARDIARRVDERVLRFRGCPGTVRSRRAVRRADLRQRLARSATSTSPPRRSRKLRRSAPR
ncbi:MAG: phage major capsid protein [Nocardioidaceae bacterium]